MNARYIDMVRSGIYGLAVGDAAGVPAEFKSRLRLSWHPVRGMTGGGYHGQQAGTWSDDTSMTLCLMDSISHMDGIDLTDIMECFMKWLNEGEYTPWGEASPETEK